MRDQDARSENRDANLTQYKARICVVTVLDYNAKDEIGAILPYRLVSSILIDCVNDVRQLAGVPLMDYNAVEGTGAVLPCRQYTEAAGREIEEDIIHSIFVCNNVKGYNVLLLNGPRSAP